MANRHTNGFTINSDGITINTKDFNIFDSDKKASIKCVDGGVLINATEGNSSVTIKVNNNEFAAKAINGDKNAVFKLSDNGVFIKADDGFGLDFKFSPFFVDMLLDTPPNKFGGFLRSLP